MTSLIGHNSTWRPPRTWVLKQLSATVAKHRALTVDGWDEPGRRVSCPEFAARRAEFKTLHATAEAIATIVTIAVRGLPQDMTADQLAAQAWRTNGIEVRLGPAIIAAIVVGYTPLRDKHGRGCAFRRRVPS